MRKQTLKEISKCIENLSMSVDRTLLVGIDGSDGSGKSFFAKELKDGIESLGLSTDIVSLDDFHNPKSIRYAQGRDSAKGFFEDSYNLEIIVNDLILPTISGKREIALGYFDCDEDVINKIQKSIFQTDVLLVEGMFIHRNELKEYWDLSVYLKTDFTVSVARGNARFNLNTDPGHVSNRRYVEGNRIYQSQCAPEKQGTIVVDNNVLNAAKIVGATD